MFSSSSVVDRIKHQSHMFIHYGRILTNKGKMVEKIMDLRRSLTDGKEQTTGGQGGTWLSLSLHELCAGTHTHNFIFKLFESKLKTRCALTPTYSSTYFLKKRIILLQNRSRNNRYLKIKIDTILVSNVQLLFIQLASQLAYFRQESQ